MPGPLLSTWKKWQASAFTPPHPTPSSIIPGKPQANIVAASHTSRWNSSFRGANCLWAHDSASAYTSHYPEQGSCNRACSFFAILLRVSAAFGDHSSAPVLQLFGSGLHYAADPIQEEGRPPLSTGRQVTPLGTDLKPPTRTSSLGRRLSLSWVFYFLDQGCPTVTTARRHTTPN